MDYTSERKRTADSQMTKATRRFKDDIGYDKGDYGDVEAKYKASAPGPTYDHELRSGDVIEGESKMKEGEAQEFQDQNDALVGMTESLLYAVLAEARIHEASWNEGYKQSKAEDHPLHKALTATGYSHASSHFQNGVMPDSHNYVHDDYKNKPVVSLETLKHKDGASHGFTVHNLNRESKRKIHGETEGQLHKAITKYSKPVSEGKEMTSTDQNLHCAVCGDRHPTTEHPQSIHTAKALSGENNMKEWMTAAQQERARNAKGAAKIWDDKEVAQADERRKEARKEAAKKSGWNRLKEVESKDIQRANKLEKCEACGQMHAHDVPCPDKKLLSDKQGVPSDEKEYPGDGHIPDPPPPYNTGGDWGRVHETKQYTHKIWTGPVGVKKYASMLHKHYPNTKAGTEHVYVHTNHPAQHVADTMKNKLGLSGFKAHDMRTREHQGAKPDKITEGRGDFYDHNADAHVSHPLIQKDDDGKHYMYMGSSHTTGFKPEYRHHDGTKLHTKHGKFGTAIHPQDSDEQDAYEKKVGTHHKGFWAGRGEVSEAKSHNKFKKWNSNQMTISTTPEDIKRKSAATVGMPPPKKVIKSKKDKPPKYKERFDESELNETNAEVEQHAMYNAQHHGVLAAHGYEHQSTDPEHYSTYRHKDTSSVHLSPNGDWKHRGKNKHLVPTEGTGAKSLERHLKTIANRKKSAGNAKAKHDALTSLGLKRVKGALGGTYYEEFMKEAKAFQDAD